MPPVGDEMTIEETANSLDMSTAYVERLINQGTLAASGIGADRRLATASVIAFRDARQAAIDGLQEITTAEEELGIHYGSCSRTSS